MATQTTLKEYQYWGNQGEPPANLKTTRQLQELGLKPVAPVGYIETRKWTAKLYDINDPTSVRPKKKATPAQLAALEKGRQKAALKRRFREWSRMWGGEIRERIYAGQRAREIIENKEKYCILDTETTGLDYDEIVEIAIIDLDGNELLNSLIKPTIEIPEDAIAIHGITNEMVAGAPEFPDIYPQLKAIAKEREILIYNWDFDTRIIDYCCNVHELKLLKLRGDCLMEEYARWYGDWSDYYQNFTWQPLSGGHRALGDCKAALEYLLEMTRSSIEYNDYIPDEFAELITDN